MNLFKTRNGNAFNNGLIAFIEQDYPLAIELLTKAAEQDHHNSIAFLILGNVYRIAGQPHRAISIHNPLSLRSDLNKQDKAKVYSALGQDYLAAGDLKNAADNYQKAISLDGRNLALRKQLFEILRKNSCIEEAYSVWEDIRRLDRSQPIQILAYLETHLARAAFNNNDTRTAEKKCRVALNLYPECVPARLLKGDILDAAGKEDAAFSEWKHIIKKTPALAFLAFSRLEKNLYKKGHYDQMLDIYQEILKSCPLSRETNLAMADFWIKRGNFSEALSQLKEASQIKPGSAEIRNQLIRLLIDQGKYSQAKEEVEKLANSCENTCRQYHCVDCGESKAEFFFECPGCGEFESINGYY